jgi:hypothetical protein
VACITVIVILLNIVIKKKKKIKKKNDLQCLLENGQVQAATLYRPERMTLATMTNYEAQG